MRGWNAISIHALLAESDLPRYPPGSECPISIHALLAESDFICAVNNRTLYISIHALLAESDRVRCRVGSVRPSFLSPLSLRSATAGLAGKYITGPISIHALLAESDDLSAFTLSDSSISIHALLAESDVVFICHGLHSKTISIHALLAESDSILPCQNGGRSSFLSTLSLRRATSLTRKGYLCPTHFYPRSPCGERPYVIRYPVNLHPISIHALLAESDLLCTAPLCPRQAFLSTLSLRRAT